MTYAEFLQKIQNQLTQVQETDPVQAGFLEAILERLPVDNPKLGMANMNILVHHTQDRFGRSYYISAVQVLASLPELQE